MIFKSKFESHVDPTTGVQHPYVLSSSKVVRFYTSLSNYTRNKDKKKISRGNFKFYCDCVLFLIFLHIYFIDVANHVHLCILFISQLKIFQEYIYLLIIYL